MSRQISTQLIAYLVGRLPVSDFEQWIQQTPELQSILSESDYNKLMAVDYQRTNAHSLIDHVLRGYIDWAQYEKEQLAELLMAIIWQDDAASALIRAHEQFTHGLRFLNVLGAEYGVSLLTPHGNQPQATRQEAVLTRIYPKAREEAKRILSRLVAGRITFTGTYTPEGYPEYTEQ